MNRQVTRRRALGAIGGMTAAAVAALSGVFPEVALGRAGMVGMPDRRGVLRHLSGDRLVTRVAASQASARGQLARAFLARRDFRGTPVHAEAAELVFEDGAPIGDVVSALFHDARDDRYARVTFQISGERSVTGVALWTGADPLRREVYDLRGNTFELSATLIGSPDGSLVIERPDGTRLAVPARGSAATSGRRGLARPLDQRGHAAEYCSWVCFLVFEWVCTTVLIETCVISAACGPLAALCAGACVIAVIASCAWNATNYCSWSCTWISGVTEQTVYA